MAIEKTVKGNLLKMFEEKQFSAIAHGCNCFCRMGSGIAEQIAIQYPEAQLVDTIFAAEGDAHKLGKFSTAFIHGNGYIHNLYTQFRGGKEAKGTLYPSIRDAFMLLAEYWDENYLISGEMPMIGIPLIGCGIAGGDWNEVSKIINEAAPWLPITVVEYDPHA